MIDSAIVHATRRWLFTFLLVAMPASFSQAQTPSKPDTSRPTRVLFLGNSITLHGPSEAIGWSGNWGMAASSAEKDYAHLLLARIAKKSGKAPESQITNIADFERNSASFDIKQRLKRELAFAPDLIIVAIGENVPALANDDARKAFRAGFTRLINELKTTGKPRIVVRSCFWADAAKDDIMRAVAQESGATWVDISALGKFETNFARSERPFKHEGVAGHPGDRGMRAIAEALWSAIEK